MDGTSLPGALGSELPPLPPAASIPSAVRGLSPREGGRLLHREQSPISPEYQTKLSPYNQGCLFVQKT